MTGPCVDERVADCPASCRLVYVVLEGASDALTQAEIVERTELTPRTARKSLSKLESRGVIESRPHIGDARQDTYHILPDSRDT